MKKSKIIFLLAASIILSSNPIIGTGFNKVYASQTINNKYSVEVIKDKFDEFLKNAKEEAKKQNISEVFIHKLGSDSLHKSSAVNINEINNAQDLFKGDNENTSNEKYVFVKINGKFITENKRIVIMNENDIVVTTKSEYENKLKERKNDLNTFSYKNGKIHSLEKIEDDKFFFTLLDAHGIWMGKEIKETNLNDIKIYTKDLKIENKLTVYNGLSPTVEEGFNHNLTFDNFKKNDEDIKKMIESAKITKDDEDREKIKKFAIEMGKINYDFSTLYSNQYSSKYNSASDLFAVTRKKSAMCMAFSTTASRAFNLMGIPSYVATAKVESGGLHAVTRSFYDGKWHTVDLTSSKRDIDISGYSEAMFYRSEDKYQEVDKDYSPKESLANTYLLANSQVIIYKKYEEWAQKQKIKDLVAVNTDAIYDYAQKDLTAMERDPENKVKERLEKRKIEKEKEEERRKIQEEKDRKAWAEWELEKEQNKKRQQEELRKLQEKFEEEERLKKQPQTLKQPAKDDKIKFKNNDKKDIQNINKGWNKINNKWFYRNNLDKLAKSEWVYDKEYSAWYYLLDNGEMATSKWIKHADSKWYYLLDNGEMATSKWIKHTDSKWYYLLDNGEMATSKWIKHTDSKWYYLLDNGEMATSKWIKHTDSKWYYLLDNGEMATSKWINGWYVNADGVWVE
ncbi:hypothetical protein EPS65_06425 [Helcococcus ovis]|uniref:hypothetical protein n=1 Tax=Helcococcus ovis TaxID=72026 RepID=UPI0039B4A686